LLRILELEITKLKKEFEPLRDKEEIISKANELFESAMDEFVDSRTGKFFRNCENNCFLSARSVGKINYCSLKTKVIGNSGDKLFVCNTNEWTNKCPDFKCKWTKDLCKKEFMEIVSSPSRCGREFPKLSTLLWAVNDGKQKESITVSNSHGHEEENENRVNLNWLRKILKRLGFR